MPTDEERELVAWAVEEVKKHKANIARIEAAIAATTVSARPTDMNDLIRGRGRMPNPAMAARAKPKPRDMRGRFRGGRFLSVEEMKAADAAEQEDTNDATEP
jgi:hypothetical protein